MGNMSDAGKLRVALQSVLYRNELDANGAIGETNAQIDNSIIGRVGDEMLYVWHPSTELDYRYGVEYRSVVERIFRERMEAEAAIQRKYDECSWFGQPTGAMSLGSDGRGYYRHFQSGSIFWLSTWGAHEVHGAIRDKYASLGWESSYLGYPTTDEIQGNTRYNNFEHGTIMWTMDQGAFIPLDISVSVELHQLGAWLHISGRGFTPGGIVRFSVEGLQGTVGPKSTGVFTFARADGRLPDDVWWDGRTWPQGGTAALRALDEATGRTATYPIPALY